MAKLTEAYIPLNPIYNPPDYIEPESVKYEREINNIFRNHSFRLNPNFDESWRPPTAADYCIIIAFVVFVVFLSRKYAGSTASDFPCRDFKICIPQIPLPPPPKFDFAQDQQSMLSARLIIERMKLPPMSHFKI